MGNGSFAIQYLDGSSVSGPIYTDTGEGLSGARNLQELIAGPGYPVTVAGVTVTGQFFSPATTLDLSFKDHPIDGQVDSTVISHV